MGQQKSRFSRVLRCRGLGMAHLRAMLTKEGDNFDINTLLDTSEYERVTPLWLAARYNEVEIVKMLLSLGANPNQACGSLNMTPLHLAALGSNIPLVEALAESRPNANLLDKWNYTPLMYVVINHEPDVVIQLVQILLDLGAVVNFGATLNENNEPHRQNCNMDLFELCSSYDGSYVTYMRDPMGPVSGTALHLAIQNPHLPNEVILLLLKAGADIDRRNLYGQTPLIGAMMDVYYDYHRHIHSHTQMLLANGANVHARDRRQWTAMHYAAQRGSISCMQALMQAGADSNSLSMTGESPLWVLLALGWKEAAQYLVRNGCELNSSLKGNFILKINQDNDIIRFGDMLPIEFTVCNRYYTLAELLVEAGCHIDQDTWLGRFEPQPQSRHSEFLQFLAEHNLRKQNVKLLRECCRDILRSSMSSRICEKIELLCLPQPIKDYICLIY